MGRWRAWDAQAIRNLAIFKLWCRQKMEHRLQQCISVLKKLTDDLGIPYSSPEVQAVKKHFDEFIRTGEPWEGSVPFLLWDRMADIRLTDRGKVEMTLRLCKSKK